MCSKRYIPKWGEVSEKKDKGEDLNPVEQIVFSNEPAELGAALKFREQVSELIDFVVKRGW